MNEARARWSAVLGRWGGRCGRGLLLAAALLAVPVSAQVPEALLESALTAPEPLPPQMSPVPPAAMAPVVPVDRTVRLEAFIDGVVGAYMADDHIAGAVVAVVDRDGVLLQKGYGIAGVDPPRAVDPATTLFRIGSISKTFTYVAAMQLAARGRIDLDGAVNAQLPPALALPDEGFGPIAVVDLMQHTAGFEDSALGHLFVRDGAAVPTLVDYLARYRPQRVRPPRLHAVYSNYGVGLLGALVAERSGMPFERYVEAELLAPLGITTATFREPLAQDDLRRVGPALASSYSSGFQREAGGYAPQPFEYISNIAPAGAASASAAAMARWMRMLLNEGSLDGARVLDAASFARMADVGYRNAEAVGGIAHGFFRQRYGRYLGLEHAGATLNFMSNMVVLPDAGVGVFVSTNTNTGRPLVMALPRLVLEQLLVDARVPAPEPVRATAADLARYVGTYRGERRPYGSLEKLFVAAGNDLAVSPGPDGSLVVAGGEGAHRHAPLGGGVFRNLDDGSEIAFLAPPQGGGMVLATSYGHTVADRIGAIDQVPTLLAVVGALFVLALGVLVGAWHRRALRQRLRHGRAAATSLTIAAALWLAWVIAAIVVTVIVAGAAATLIFDYPGTAVRVVVGLAWVAAAATLLALLTFGPALRARDWSAWRKLRHAVVLVVMVLAVVLLVRWNVLFAPLALA